MTKTQLKEIESTLAKLDRAAEETDRKTASLKQRAAKTKRSANAAMEQSRWVRQRLRESGA
jgi:hypothetical protein